MRRILHGIAIAALPVAVALLVAPTAFGGTVLPWQPWMADLDVYRHAGEVVLNGGDIYLTEQGRLPFLYPAFSAVLAVPLAVLPQDVVQIGWLIGCVLALLAVMHRVGLQGWMLSIAGAAVIYFVEPVRDTLAYGQLGIFLVALVFLELAPPGVGRRRRPGLLTGFATAIKLTPGLFFVYLLAIRRRADAVRSVLVFVGFTIVGALVLPSASLDYWLGLLQGDTGTSSYHYATNQSVFGTWLRIVGLGPVETVTGLVLAVLIAALGLWAAAVWYADGRIALAVCLAGVAGLLASPISWSHHFVWVVPLGILLLDAGLPGGLRMTGLLFCGWVAAAPFMRLPKGGDVELEYVAWQQLLDSITPLLGIAMFVAAVWTSRVRVCRVCPVRENRSTPALARV